MNIWILNKDIQPIGIVDDYESVIWTTRYSECGDFELYLAADTTTLSLIQEGCYLVRDNDVDGKTYKNVMIAENFELQTDEENGDHLIITGRCIKSILKRRIVIDQTIMNANIQDCIQTLLNQNVISPTNNKRKISNFLFVGNADITGTMQMQATGDNLGDLITEICNNYELGYDVYIANGKFCFTLTKGVDRSLNQTANPHIIFSPEFDNLLSSDYVLDNSNFANIAIVAGEGEGIARKKKETGTTSASGLDRYEIFVDARDLSTNDGEITNSDYMNMLAEKGNEALAEKKVVISFEGEVDSTRNYVLNSDFFIGDIVQVINEYGITKASRVIEIIESEDQNGASVIPTFAGI